MDSLGNRGDTQRKPYDNERGRPLSMLIRGATGRYPVDIRKRNFTGSARESDLPIVPLAFQGQHNLERGKGQCFHRVSEEGKEGDCR